VLDEAHASGVYGIAGRGYASEAGQENIVDASVVTLSKAMGCAGGAICSSQKFCDAAVNFARAYIYSTAVPPGVAAGIQAAIKVVEDEPHRQHRVRALARQVRTELGLKNTPDDSPIIPIILGNESAALGAAGQLRRAGLLVIAVRPPSVAPGSSRLRITVSSDHRDEEIQRLIAEVKRILK
jgi:8-amino-7-oxononanoate synthase